MKLYNNCVVLFYVWSGQHSSLVVGPLFFTSDQCQSFFEQVGWLEG